MAELTPEQKKALALARARLKIQQATPAPVEDVTPVTKKTGGATTTWEEPSVIEKIARPVAESAVAAGKMAGAVLTEQLPQAAAAYMQRNVQDYLKTQSPTPEEQERLKELALGAEDFIGQSQQEFERKTKGIPKSYKDVDTTAEFLKYAGGQLGQAGGQIIPSIVSGGASSYLQESQAVYRGQVERIAREKGITTREVIERGLDDPAAGQAFAVGAVGLDMISNFIPFAKGAKVFKTFLRNTALETITEPVQGILEEVGAGEDFASTLSSKRIDEAFGGLLGGGAISAATMTINPSKIAKVQEEVQKIENETKAARVAEEELKTITTGDPALDLQQDVEAQKVIDEITQGKDAIQVEEIGQVPVQPEAAVNQELAQGTPQVEPQATPQESQVVPNTEFVPSDETTVKGDIRESIRPSAPEVVTDEYKLLKERIRNYARGVREGSQDAKKAFRGIGKELETIVDTQQLPAKAQTRLLKRATAVNYNNPLQVERLFDYADKLVQDAAYVDKVEKAEATQSKLRGLLPNIPVEQKDAVKSLIKLDPENVDIDVYNSLLDEVSQAKKSVGRGFEVVPLQKVQDFVDRNSVELEEKIDTVVDEATKDAKEEDKKLILKPLFDVAKSKLSDAKGVTKVQQDVIDGLSKADMNKMSAEDMRKFVKIAENIAQNGSFGGSAEFAARLSAETTSVPKGVKPMNEYLQSVSEKISTAAEIFNDVTGFNKAASELTHYSGFAGMYKQTSQVEQLNTEFKEKIDKLVKKVDEKYKGRSIYDAESLTTSSVWAELQQRLPDETEQEGFDRAKTNIEEDLNRKKVYDPKQYALEIKDWNILGKANTLQEAESIMKKSFPKEYEVVELTKKEFEELADDNITTAETIFNRTTPKLINYSPISTVPINPNSVEVDDDMRVLTGEITAPRKPKQGGSTRNRMLYLPKDFVRNRDFLNNVFNAHRKMLYDIKVAPQVLKVGQFLRSENARTQLGQQNLEVLTRLFNNQINTKRAARTEIFDKTANQLLDGVTKLGAVRALGGISTGITQAAPTIANTMVNLGGDMGIMFRLGTTFKSKKSTQSLRKILNENTIGQRLTKMGGVNIGEEVDVKTRGLINKEFRKVLTPLIELKEKAYHTIMTPFAYGDAKPAELAWASYYVKSLKDQGIDISGYTKDGFWEKEAGLQDTDNRGLAAAYAEQMINSNLNPSQSDQFASILRANTIEGKILKAIAFPLVSFKLNQSKRLSKALARIAASKGTDTESLKIAGAIVAETAAYIAALELIAKPLIAKPIEQVIRDMFDMPDDREEDEDFQRRLLWTNVAQNITPFMLNEMTTNFVIDLFNLLGYSASDTDESFEKWNKENGLITFEKKGLDTFGMVGLGLAAPSQLYDDMTIIWDGEDEVVNPYTGDVQILNYEDNKDLIAFSAVVNLMSSLGVNFREIANANAKLRKQATREAKGGGTSTPSPFLPNLPNIQMNQPVVAQPLIHQPQIPIIQ